MSIVNVSPLSPSKLLSGGGDGIRNSSNKSLNNRKAVPSCRRLGTRGKPNPSAKQKIEKALAELSSEKKHKTTPLKPRRSTSMAEITPTKNNLIKELTVFDARCSTTPKKRRYTDAGRLIYQMLLLNAWRQRRNQVTSLIDASNRLQTRISKMQVQISVLQKLREAECKRRNEASQENQLLRNRLEQIESLKDQIELDKRSLENILKAEEEHLEKYKIEVENARNNLISVRSQLKLSEIELDRERNKIIAMKNEEKRLHERICELVNEIEFKQKIITEKGEMVQSLKKANENIEQLYDAKVIECSKILTEMESKEEENKALKYKIINSQLKYSKLNLRLNKIHEEYHDISNNNTKLTQENKFLKETIAMLEKEMIAEKNKPWWKSARQLVSSPLDAIQNAAILIFPTLAQPDTSTIEEKIL